MAVYINDSDALDRMGMVEGRDWVRDQKEWPNRRTGFFAFLETWREWFGDEDEDMADEIVDVDGETAIYGREGYSRYAVRGDGEIVLLGWSAREAVRERARRAGFRVTGAD